MRISANKSHSAVITDTKIDFADFILLQERFRKLIGAYC